MNIGPIPDQVPEQINERAQENDWSFIFDILFQAPDVVYYLAEFLVSML
jgi:hypothetical protein